MFVWKNKVGNHRLAGRRSDELLELESQQRSIFPEVNHAYYCRQMARGKVKGILKLGNEDRLMPHQEHVARFRLRFQADTGPSLKIV